MYQLIRRLTRKLHVTLLVAAGATLAACGGSDTGDMAEPAASAPQDAGVRYVADRLIIGDGRVLEPGEILVRDGMIAAVGEPGSTGGGSVMNLNGMTIMPAIVDAHVHMSTNREDLLRDLRQRAAMGVSAAQSMGSDGVDAPLELRSESIPGAARYLSAGRGITAPEPGRTEVPHWVTSEAEARQAVRAEAERGVDMIKIWVDDRNGQYDKLSEELYSAIIDEAHTRGLRAAAHIFALEDGKGLLRAGIDVFAHGVRERDIDDEFMALVSEHPDVILIPNLPARGVPFELDWLSGILDADQLAALEENNVENPAAQAAWGIQARNLARLSIAGMKIAMGTDGNTFWQPHIEMEDMVAAGMTPHQVLVAATSGSAMALGLDDTGVLEAGKRADFIVLGSNPLADIRNTRDIADVYLAGVQVDR
ncbi:MAG: amidohydrolase family protein [Gammaproteobacteria bacterium]|jgi:imidazolonepropionase-like amidohydrolase